MRVNTTSENALVYVLANEPKVVTWVILRYIMEFGQTGRGREIIILERKYVWRERGNIVLLLQANYIINFVFINKLIKKINEQFNVIL